MFQSMYQPIVVCVYLSVMILVMGRDEDTHHIISNSTDVCDLLEWAPWSNCTGPCGSETQIRLRWIACPHDVNTQDADSCIEGVCNYTKEQYTEYRNCTQKKDCKTDCKDKLPNCHYYIHACTGVFEKWARKNCILTCGYCKGFKKCEDLTDCAHLPGTLCTDPKYREFAMTSCNKYCGFCNGTKNSQQKKPLLSSTNLISKRRGRIKSSTFLSKVHISRIIRTKPAFFSHKLTTWRVGKGANSISNTPKALLMPHIMTSFASNESNRFTPDLTRKAIPQNTTINKTEESTDENLMISSEQEKTPSSGLSRQTVPRHTAIPIANETSSFSFEDNEKITSIGNSSQTQNISNSMQTKATPASGFNSRHTSTVYTEENSFSTMEQEMTTPSTEISTDLETFLNSNLMKRNHLSKYNKALNKSVNSLIAAGEQAILPTTNTPIVTVQNVTARTTPNNEKDVFSVEGILVIAVGSVVVLTFIVVTIYRLRRKCANNANASK